MPQLFTASPIAAVLGVSPQAIRKRLRTVPASGLVMVAGKPAQAWAWDALPADLREQLSEASAKQGYRSSQEALEQGDAPWQPRIALAALSEETLAAALKLKRALARMVARRNDRSISAEELERLGAEDYRREFGFAVSARHVRALFKRTRQRCRGDADFDRLEVYLPDRLTRKADAGPARAALELPEMQAVLDAFKDPARPSVGEVHYLWVRALEYFGSRAARGEAAKKVRRELLDYLWAKVPGLAATRAALEKAFKRRLAAQAGDKSFADGRKN